MNYLIQITAYRVYVWRYDANGKLISEADYRAIENIQGLDEDKPLTVLIPSEEVVLTTVEMPKMSQAELRKAIPFTLEDQVASDLSSSFFAFEKTDVPGKYAVAIIDLKLINSYLKALADIKLHPDVLLPSCLALPWQPESWTLLQQEEQVLVRVGKLAGFELPLENFALLFPLMLEKYGVPKQLVVLGELKVDLTPFGISIQQQVLETPFVQAITQEPALNLLQGKFRAKRKRNKQKRRWRWCIYLLILYIVLIVGFKIGAYFYLRYQNQVLAKVINQAVAKVHSDHHSFASPKAMLEHMLTVISKREHSNQFQEKLSKVSTVLHRYPAVVLDGVAYKQDQLQIGISAADVKVLHQTVTMLANQGLTVTAGQTKQLGKTVGMEVTIK